MVLESLEMVFLIVMVVIFLLFLYADLGIGPVRWLRDWFEEGKREAERDLKDVDKSVEESQENKSSKIRQMARDLGIKIEGESDEHLLDEIKKKNKSMKIRQMARDLGIEIEGESDEHLLDKIKKELIKVELKKSKQRADAISTLENADKPTEDLLVLALKSKNLNEKLEYCTRYLELNPNDADAWHYKKEILSYLGRRKEAVECERIRAEFFDSPYAIAFIQFYSARYEEAVKCFEDILKEKPDDAMGWLMKGEALVRLERYPEGIECLDKALKLGLSKVNEAMAWFGKGRAFNDLDRKEEAISCYDRSLAIDPGNPEVLLFKGLMLAQNPETFSEYSSGFPYEKAGKCYLEVLEILKVNPEHELAILAKEGGEALAKTWYCKGLDLDDLDRHQEAIACYDKAIEIYPKHANVWYLKGLDLGSLGMYQEALACLDEAIEINPRDAGPYHSKGIMQRDMGRYQEALACFDKAIEIDPRDDKQWNDKGVVLIHLGRHQEALACFDKAIEINPKDDRPWNNKRFVQGELRKG